MRIHDAERDIEWHTKAIKEITDTIELIQQAQIEFNRRLSVSDAERATLAMVAAHNTITTTTTSSTTPKDEFVEKAKDLFFEVVKYVAIALIVWGMVSWGQAQGRKEAAPQAQPSIGVVK